MKRKFTAMKTDEFEENSKIETTTNHHCHEINNYNNEALKLIQIFINCGGKNFTLNIMAEYTIEKIKLQIMDKTQIPIEYQILKYSSTILNDKMTAEFYNINKEATIFLSTRTLVKKFLFFSHNHIK